MLRLCLAWVLAVLLCASFAQADWFDWTNGVHRSFKADPDDYPGGDAKEIVGLWWGRDDTYDYFRMDLGALPTLGDYADVYGIYIYSNPSDGAPISNAYVPDDVIFAGTDQLLATYLAFGSVSSAHLQDWYDGSGPGGGPMAGWYDTNLTPIGDYFQQLTSGVGYEWRIPSSALPTDYGFRGTTFNFGAQTPYDITDWDDTPEPGTWALMALGLPALVWYSKRRRGK